MNNLASLQVMLRSFIDDKRLAGINCLIWKKGQLLFQESYGYRNLSAREALTSDSIFRISSMTKPITSLLALILYQEGKFNFNDPITRWFPQFDKMRVWKETGDHEVARKVITIFDLLTHSAGFTYSEFQKGNLKEEYRRVLGGDIDTDLSLEDWIEGLACLPLISQPGELFNYGRSTDLLGVLLSKIEGQSLSAIMKDRIFEPLGMSDTFFTVPDEKRNRCAANIGYDQSGHLVELETVPLNMAFKHRPADLEFESGGQGLWSTAGDYLKFARIFVENGASNGVQLLDPELLHYMTSNQLTDSQRENSTLMGAPIFAEGFGFGLGVARVMEENISGAMPCHGSVGSVGWPGAYGGWWSADPVRETVSIFLTHSMTTPDQLAQGIGFQLYEAIEVFSLFSTQMTH